MTKILSGDVAARYLVRVVSDLVGDKAHAVKQRILPNLRKIFEHMEFLDRNSLAESLLPMIDSNGRELTRWATIEPRRRSLRDTEGLGSELETAQRGAPLDDTVWFLLLGRIRFSLWTC